MLKQFMIGFALSLIATAASVSPARAAGGDSGGGSGGSSTGGSASGVVEPSPISSVPRNPVKSTPKPATTATVPPATTIWKKKWGDLGPRYAAAVKLVKEERFAEAITALKALQKPKDPRVLNYLGYSHRKLGKIEEALPYYYLALNIAPEYIPAHEYLGEAYVQMNDLAKAKAELRVIEKLCGNRSCEEYRDLAASIQKAAGSG